MLSSAKKSVPTIKQFIQPYFIEIAPDGVVIAACARFTAILQKRGIYNFLEQELSDIFAQLGGCDPLLPSGFRKDPPSVIDLSVNGQHSKPFTIRWTLTPLGSNTADPGGGWQLTGMKLYGKAAGTDPRNDRRAEEKDTHYQANLVNYVSDIIISTDLEHTITQWNKAAEKFYDIPARQAIGRSLREVIHHEYLNTTEKEADSQLRRQGQTRWPAADDQDVDFRGKMPRRLRVIVMLSRFENLRIARSESVEMELHRHRLPSNAFDYRPTKELTLRVRIINPRGLGQTASHSPEMPAPQ